MFRYASLSVLALSLAAVAGCASHKLEVPKDLGGGRFQINDSATCGESTPNYCVLALYDRVQQSAALQCGPKSKVVQESKDGMTRDRPDWYQHFDVWTTFKFSCAPN